MWKIKRLFKKLLKFTFLLIASFIVFSLIFGIKAAIVMSIILIIYWIIKPYCGGDCTHMQDVRDSDHWTPGQPSAGSLKAHESGFFDKT